MLKKLLSKLLQSKTNKYGGGHYRPYHSSDDYRKRPYGSSHPNHNQYGHGHYRRKRKSSFFSSS